MGFIKKLFKKGAGVPSEVKDKGFYSSSEYVSTGHPDRVADLLAAAVINDIQKKDGVNSHAAVEVFLTHDTVYFGGEVTTTLDITKEYLQEVVKLGFLRAGYFPEMRKHWTKKEVVLAEDLKIVNKICAQSPDIALGTTDKGEESGWNDQGVYFSSCDNSNVLGMGYPHYVAKLVSDELSRMSRIGILADEEPMAILGPDNKCVITVKTDEDGFTPKCVTAVTIAVAHSSKSNEDVVRGVVKTAIMVLFRKNGIKVADGCQWVINGTGRFVVHGCISDTSMTGRKISVNHPSAGPVWCNKMIGGGSLVKPAHASDLMLNLMSRYIAEMVVWSGMSSYAVVGCSGAIGVQGLQSLFIKGDDEFEKTVDKEKLYAFFFQFIKWSPIAIANKFGFFDENFDFGLAVKSNFFGEPDFQPWEDAQVLQEDIDNMNFWMSNV